MTSKPGKLIVPGIKACPLVGWAEVRRLPGGCLGGVRCRGGVSSSQALAWNRRTCRPDSDGQSKWALFGPLVARGRAQAVSTVRAKYREAQGRNGPYER